MSSVRAVRQAPVDSCSVAGKGGFEEGSSALHVDVVEEGDLIGHANVPGPSKIPRKLLLLLGAHS